MNNYGQDVELTKDTPVQFPDFSITYIGDEVRDLPNQNLAIKQFIYQKYIIKADGQEDIKLAWSSGMGDLVPMKFIVNSKEFSFNPWEKVTTFIQLS